MAAKEQQPDELSQRLRALEARSAQLMTASGPQGLSANLAETVLSALDVQMAVLDAGGNIVGTNRQWARVAESNGARDRTDGIGFNYLEVCDAAAATGDRDAKRVAEGLRQVMRGERPELTVEYPCDSPTERKWFLLRAARMAGPGGPRMVLTHEDVTALRLAQERLKVRETEIEEQRRTLEEINTTLKVLLEKREQDRKELEERMLSNVKEGVLPWVEKLREVEMDRQGRQVLDVLEHNLREIVSPFLSRLASRFFSLTRQEIEVAGLVRSGKTTKEIAGILNVSTDAVDFHRKNIRKKLGLKRKKENLRAHLLTLS